MLAMDGANLGDTVFFQGGSPWHLKCLLSMPNSAIGPTIEFPTEIAPAGLKVVELFEGNGPMVRRGDTVTVNYHGVVWGKDAPFDSSFDRHQPATFGIGVGQVIKGVGSDRSGTQRRFPPGGVHSAGVRLWLPWRSAGRASAARTRWCS